MTWGPETKILMNIHQNWNTVQAEAVKAGMNTDIKESFDQKLDLLTAEINNQNDAGSLMAAIGLYGELSELAQLFQGEIPPAFYDGKYEVMMVTGLGQMGEWEQARSELPNMKDRWESLKMQSSEKAKPQTTACTEIAIRDLARAVESESRELVMIKGEIAVKDMMKLQEELSSKKMSSQ